MSELVEAHVLLVNECRRIVVIGDAETRRANLELMEVGVLPSEGDLENSVKERERCDIRHDHTAPDSRLDVSQLDEQLILSPPGRSARREVARPLRFRGHWKG